MASPKETLAKLKARIQKGKKPTNPGKPAMKKGLQESPEEELNEEPMVSKEK